MQKKIDKLFRLIKSMQPSEKVFFKKMANIYRKSGTSSYVILFDAIDKQKEYSEEKLVKKLKDTSFVKHLAVSKNHLYDNILRSLRLYRSAKDPRRKLYQNLQDIHTLKEMDLQDDLQKKIESTKKLAWETDEFGALLELINLQRGIFTSFRSKDAMNALIELNKEKRKIIAYEQNSQDYVELRDLFTMEYRNIGRGDKTEFKAFLKTLLENELLQDVNNALSFKAKHFCLVLKVDIHQELEHVEESFEYSQQLADLWHSHPIRIAVYPSGYWSSLAVFVMQAAFMKQMEAIKEILDKALKMPKDTWNAKLAFFTNYHAFQSVYIMLSHDYDVLEDAVAFYEKEEKKYGKYRTPKGILKEHALYAHYSTIHLHIGDYESALQWNLKLLDFSEDLILPHWYYIARLKSILIHYCLGNDYLLDSVIRSVERKLKNENVFNTYEKLFVRMFKVLKDTPDREKKYVLKEYLEKYTAIEDSEIMPYVYEGFDIVLWLQASIEKKTVKKYMRTKELDKS